MMAINYRYISVRGKYDFEIVQEYSGVEWSDVDPYDGELFSGDSLDDVVDKIRTKYRTIRQIRRAICSQLF